VHYHSHLLAHSSGLAYEQISPLLVAWRASRNETSLSNPTIETRANDPLLFEPGTAWIYGTGTDWAGKLVERAKSLTLEDYMSSHIWGPLGLVDVTFWPRTKPYMAGRIAEMSTWNKDGKCVWLVEDFDPNDGATDCLGGSGASASAQDFFKLMQAILRRDERLLKQSESWEELFRPQLTSESKEAWQRLLESGEVYNLELGANFPLGGAKSWSLGGLVSLDGYDGWFGEGTMLWSGLPNIRWVSLWGDYNMRTRAFELTWVQFIDPKTGLCGLVAAQLIEGEAKAIKELSVQFQKRSYEMFAASKA
jgi:CubicO group peptidase (beta-lactamase class C family)